MHVIQNTFTKNIKLMATAGLLCLVAFAVLGTSKVSAITASPGTGASGTTNTTSTSGANGAGAGAGATAGGAAGACDPNKKLAPDPALCGGNSCSLDSADKCNITTKYLNPFINDFLAPLAILAVIVGVVWGAIQYITSGGDPQKVASAKAHIQRSLIGLLAFIFLFAFLQWLIPGGLI